MELDNFLILLPSHRWLGDPKSSFHFILLLSFAVQDAIASASIILLKIWWVIMNLISVHFIDKNHRRSLRQTLSIPDSLYGCQGQYPYEPRSSFI